MPKELKINDANEFEWMWRTGRDPSTGEQVKVEDALATTNAPVFLPQVISNVVKEAVEPLLVGTSLLTRINYSYAPTITFPAVGALHAADINEGQEYPERELAIGGAQVTAQIGKSGVAVAITDEMVRYSQFDVIGMHLRAAGKALGRWKETKIFNMIRSMGQVAFDNLDPTNSFYGPCTGRDINGGPNGACTMDNVFDTFAQVVINGFMPNTILMHPLTWTMWVKDAQLRSFVQANGGGVFFATWTGNPAGQAPWSNGAQGKMGLSPGQSIIPGKTSEGAASPHGETPSPLKDFPQFINSAPVLPSYLNVPFMIVVSPYVYFDPHRKLTDIYMFDSSELGAYIVDEEVTTEEFDDPRVDIRKIKLRERYGFAIFNEGHGISVIKNVHVVPNEVPLPVQPTLDVSSGWTAIDPATALPI